MLHYALNFRLLAFVSILVVAIKNTLKNMKTSWNHQTVCHCVGFGRIYESAARSNAFFFWLAQQHMVLWQHIYIHAKYQIMPNKTNAQSTEEKLKSVKALSATSQNKTKSKNKTKQIKIKI